ncbi:MAG: hypothetical protein WCK08_19135 [Betaproteobacteria bacterium]
MKKLRPFLQRLLALCLIGTALAGLNGCSDPTDFVSDHEIARLPPLGPTAGAEPMLRLDSKELPATPMVYDQTKESYYSCAGVVGDWFLQLVVAEMNFLARQHGLERLDGTACALSVTKSGMGSGRIKVHLYKDATEANDCVFKSKCGLARNVTLIPTPKAVLRSYFLSDLQGEKFYQHCLAPPELWHKGVSCEYIGLEAALGIKKEKK